MSVSIKKPSAYKMQWKLIYGWNEMQKYIYLNFFDKRFTIESIEGGKGRVLRWMTNLYELFKYKD